MAVCVEDYTETVNQVKQSVCHCIFQSSSNSSGGGCGSGYEHRTARGMFGLVWFYSMKTYLAYGN
jgi:hypothetical protein